MKLKLKDNLFRVNDTIISYDTEVATISGKKLIEHGKYSRTTSKHIHHVASLYGLEIVRAKEKEPFCQYEYGVKCSLPGALSKSLSKGLSQKMVEGMDYIQAISITEGIGKRDWEIILKDLSDRGISISELELIRKATKTMQILG